MVLAVIAQGITLSLTVCVRGTTEEFPCIVTLIVLVTSQLALMLVLFTVGAETFILSPVMVMVAVDEGLPPSGVV